MIRAENFIYFLSACGFFVGIIFSTFANIEPAMILWTTASITAIFYMIGLATSALFIREIEIKATYSLDTGYYDEQLDKAKEKIEKRESYLRDASAFINVLEDELKSKKGEDPL